MPEPRVLLVEDDPHVRRLVARELARLGLEVTAVESAEEALRMEEPTDLLVTDRSLPGMNGEELARTLRQRAPHLKVLLISGVPQEPEDDTIAFLFKPFSPSELKSAVAALLKP